jgi:MFS family permease
VSAGAPRSAARNRGRRDRCLLRFEVAFQGEHPLMLRYPGPTDVRTTIESPASPFSKLAIAHALGVSGDIFVTVALADSIFFSVADPNAARPKVLLYLLFTMAPFAIVAPVLGPLLDRTRGGRRMLFLASCAGRAILCLFMASNIKGLALYPLAFGSLVLSKGQNIAKSALVPAVVDDESELVRANSRLQLISVIAGTLGASIAAGFLKTVGGSWVLRVGALVFLAATVASFRIPRAKEVAKPETSEERRELHVASIVAAGSAMGLLRGAVGFMTFFVGLLLKTQGEPAWVFGFVLGMSAAGNGIGVLLAPLLRRKIREEWILTGSILIPAVLLVFAARSSGRASLSIAAFAIAGGAACGRLVFDSLVQRDAPDAARGRAFARFETRFQIVWVVGGVVAVSYHWRERGGLFLLALVLLFAGLSYFGAARRTPVLADRVPPTHPDGEGAAANDRGPRGIARRHLPGRRRGRKSPPAPASTDDPPDAFPAGS